MASEYIKLRQSALNEYEKEVRNQLKNSDSLSMVILAGALESFGKGFDAAIKCFEPPPPATKSDVEAQKKW